MTKSTRRTAISVGLAGLLAVALLAPAASAGKKHRNPARCAAFKSQAAAQSYFLRHGGRRGKPVGRLDGDRDGIACESLAGAYAGYANLGYSKRKRFFYGFAWMPADPDSESGFACLYGNLHFPDGPRTLGVYRVRPRGRGPVRVRDAEVATQADPANGHLVWKLQAGLAPGRYFAAFDQRIPLTPYGGNECPGFRSPTVTLPRPARR